MRADELLDMFSIDKEKGGGLMFMVYALDMETGATAAEAVAYVCKLAHMPRPAVYSAMKKALAPVFEAEPGTLEALGLRPQSTTAGLARELIRSRREGRK